jgi:SAM-dependent methyltransferase
VTRRSRSPFDTADPAERARLDAHAALWDPFTCRTLDTVGVGEGWRCLEIGAGTGLVAEWLSQRVGPHGQVVATDIETRWFAPLASANLVVHHHDTGDDPLDDDGYHLVHARLVLEHLPNASTVVAKLLAALRPGGWLVAEDYDTRAMALASPRSPSWNAVHQHIPAAMGATGSDPTFGSQLLDLFTGAGLADVTVEGHLLHLPLAGLAPVFRAPLEALRYWLVDTAGVTADDVETTLAAFDDPATPPATSYTPILVSARGRRR